MLNVVKLFAEEILSIKEMGKLKSWVVLEVVCYNEVQKSYILLLEKNGV